MGDCQIYGPFLGPYYNTGPNTGPNLGDPKRDHHFDNPPNVEPGLVGFGWILGWLGAWKQLPPEVRGVPIALPRPQRDRKIRSPRTIWTLYKDYIGVLMGVYRGSNV